MANSSLTTTMSSLKKIAVKNSPNVLTVAGVVGLFASLGMAIDASKKADKVIEQEVIFRHEEYSDDEPISLEDKVLLTWKIYAPTAVMVLSTAGCIIMANHIHNRRYAALASLLAVAETGLREYQAKVVDTIGEKKEEILRGEIAKDHVNENPPSKETIIFTGHGNYLCYDYFSKRYFRSNIDLIQKAENKFNQRLLREGWLGINEFYYELGLEPIELGDEFGWIAERNMLEIKRSTIFATLADGSQEPSLVIDYMVSPHHI